MHASKHASPARVFACAPGLVSTEIAPRKLLLPPRQCRLDGSRSERPGDGRRGVGFVACLLTVVLLTCSRGRASADTQTGSVSTGELKQMTVEQLMNVEVTSVSKQPQKLLRAPASIQVITSEEIRRSGATTLPEALRLADNLQVAQVNAHDWAISARGFNTNLADKLLVLIDGRAVYTPLYGGVLWNVQDYPLADIDRIEVISGPGGALWGANAVNGVINIITKSAQDTQGLYAKAAGGNELQEQGVLRYGGELAPDVYWRAYGKYTDFGDEVTSTLANAGDAWHMGRTGFRMDAAASRQDQFTLQGDFYDGTDGTAEGGEALSGGNILGRWTRTMSSGASMSLQTYYDHTSLAQPSAASPAEPPYYTGFPAADLTDDLDTSDVDFQYRFDPDPVQQIIWGLGYRATHEVDLDLNVVRFLPPVLNQNLYSGFLQDEISLARTVSLTLGSKLEHNDYTGYEVEPDIRLQWNLDPTQLLWAAVSRAVQTPTRYDRNLEVPTGLVNAPAPYQFPTAYLTGTSDFVSETLIAYEIGYRAALGPRLSGSISTFYNDYNDLRGTVATPTTALYPYPYPIYIQNDLEGETHGLELSTTYQVVDWWQLHAGYDLLLENIHAKPGEVDATDATSETADPKHQVSLRSSMDLPHQVTLDATLRWVDAFDIDDGPTAGPVVGVVPSYFELGTRLAWHVTRRLELSLVGQNLLHPYHVEYGYPVPAREEIARSVFAQVSWGY
jgi:iron complex outermembrane receptor protein